MNQCCRCGKAFDESEEEDILISDFPGLLFSDLKPCICGTCAVEALYNMEDGICYLTCERCGKTFDYIEEQTEYVNRHTWCNGLTLIDRWDDDILCCDCAMDDEQ